MNRTYFCRYCGKEIFPQGGMATCFKCGITQRTPIESKAAADSRRKEITIEQALALLRKEYNLAKGQSFVNNPVAYALYQTWKEADQRRSR